MVPVEFQASVLDDLGEAIDAVLGDPGIPGSGTDQAGECLVAVVSFAGDHIRGAVGIRMPTAVAAATHPNPGEPHCLADLADWTAEISNQCLGGVKARLLGRGYPVWCSTPVTLTGLHVELVGECISRAVALEQGNAVVWMQISWWEQPPDLQSTQAMMPGAMTLF